MWEGDIVKELYLDQWILWVNVEVDVDHNVKDNHQAEDDDIWADALHFPDHVDGR